MSKVVNIDIDSINELINKLNTMVENNDSEHLDLSSPRRHLETPSGEHLEPEVVAEPVTKNKRGRKPKYATDEERHQAAILHQREYRRRKKQQFEDMRKQIDELSAILETRH